MSSDLHAVFNFYAKITPPPGYATFVEGWWSLGSYVETLDHYVGAQLHRNINKGKFPYVNFSTFTGTHDRITNDFMNPDPELIKAVVKGHGMPGIQVNHPGGYDEVKTLDGHQILPDLPPKIGSVFMISTFKALISDTEISNSSQMETDWSRWAGINAIKEALPSGVFIGNTGLYRRFTPGEPYKAGYYVIRCHLPGLTPDSPFCAELLNILVKNGSPEGLELLDSALYCLDEDCISLPKQ